jgi:hypothetical protein
MNRKVILGTLAGLALMGLVGGSSSKPSEQRNVSQHDVRYVQPLNQKPGHSFVGHLDLLVTEHDRRVGLEEGVKTRIIDGRGTDIEGPVMLKRDRDYLYGDQLITTPEIVDFMVGDGLEGAIREPIPNDHTILRLSMSDDRWSDSFMIVHYSNRIFSGRYADITEFNRPDNTGEVLFVDQGREGIVDYLVLHPYHGKKTTIDLNTLDNVDKQRRVSYEKDRLLERTESNHTQCTLGSDCPYNTTGSGH